MANELLTWLIDCEIDNERTALLIPMIGALSAL